MTFECLLLCFKMLNFSSRRHCWVCFSSSDEDDRFTHWVSPCKCRGTAKWVHKKCLQRWIDEKQQGNSSVEVACPQCNSKYVIIYPNSDFLVKYLELIDRLYNKISPLLAGSILLGSVYWTTVSYG
jgi:E3 ubiquitin-protein ligase MARCH5